MQSVEVSSPGRSQSVEMSSKGMSARDVLSKIKKDATTLKMMALAKLSSPGECDPSFFMMRVRNTEKPL